MSKHMTDYADPLRVTADAVIQKIAHASLNPKGVDPNELLAWIGNELVQAVQDHDNIDAKEIIAQIGIDGTDYTMTPEGFLIDENEIKRLTHEQAETSRRRYLTEGSIIEQIFGKGVTIDDMEDLNEPGPDEESPSYRIDCIADILEIDIEDIAGFTQKDPDDYFNFDEWMIARGADPAEIEDKLAKLLKLKLCSIARRKPNKSRKPKADN